jgi:GNAT superfamily N-acetyltransferase
MEQRRPRFARRSGYSDRLGLRYRIEANGAVDQCSCQAKAKASALTYWAVAGTVALKDPIVRESHVVTATPRQKPPPLLPQRLAQASDAPAISELMRASVLDLFPHFYDERQTASSAMYIAHLDMQLIEDGTYFVHEAGGEIVACGGWSRRNKLYTGSGSMGDDERLLDPGTEPARVRAMFVRSDWTRRGLGTMILEASEAAAAAEGFRSLSLMATEPGVPLYQRCGFTVVEQAQVPMPDGCSITCTAMEKPIAT